VRRPLRETMQWREWEEEEEEEEEEGCLATR